MESAILRIFGGINIHYRVMYLVYAHTRTYMLVKVLEKLGVYFNYFSKYLSIFAMEGVTLLFCNIIDRGQ